MALRGTLDTFGLPDVLRLLASTGKSGRLQVDGEQGQGSIWLRDGAVLNALTDRSATAPTDEALADLLRYEMGAFAFDAGFDGDQATNGTEPHEIEQLLSSASRLLDEWNELLSVVPSLDHQVGLVATLPDDHQEVRLDTRRWEAITAIGPGCTAGELGARLDLTELDVLRIVHEMVELGTVAVAPPGR